MFNSNLLRLTFPFRVVATIFLIWLVSSSQSMAWDNVGYRPYYNQPVYYSTYNPYTRSAYYQTYYPATYYSPRPTYVPIKARPDATINRLRVKQTPITSNKKTPIEHQPQDISAKKQAFIDALLPYIQKENARLKELHQRTRNMVLALDAGFAIPEKSQLEIQQLAKRYRVKSNALKNPQARAELLKKIDVIPASLTLAQAANESAWGKSRFATEANNLFGIWTYDESKGLKPLNREADKKHLVRKFENLGESVQYYMQMLNSHPAYKKLRDIRHQARSRNQTPDGLAMAGGLEKYSARGKQYIQLIQDLILQNQWALLDTQGPSV